MYWKLSLVIHPDKCDDPCAAAAFDASKKAYETLKDETQRKALDEKRKSAKDREEFEAWLKNEREKAIWREKRNESLQATKIYSAKRLIRYRVVLTTIK